MGAPPALLLETTELHFVLLASVGHKNRSCVPLYLLALSCSFISTKSFSAGKHLSLLISCFWMAGGAVAQVFFSIYLRTVHDFMLLLVIQLPKWFRTWFSALILEDFIWGFKSLSCCSPNFLGHCLIKDTPGRKKNFIIQWFSFRKSGTQEFSLVFFLFNEILVGGSLGTFHVVSCILFFFLFCGFVLGFFWLPEQSGCGKLIPLLLKMLLSAEGNYLLYF